MVSSYKIKGMRSLILTAIFLSVFKSTYPQEGQVSDVLTSMAEELAENEADPEAVEIYIDKLNELTEKPVNLNSADETELTRLFFLTDFQIKALADYTNTTGKIVSVYELANIPGFGRELAEMIIPFIILDPKPDKPTESRKIRNTLLTNFSSRYPPVENKAIGPQWKLLTRYKLTAGKFSGGFTGEKDAGEKLLTGKPPLPDFLSANLAWSGTGILRKIVVGDYGGRFGLGTNVNTGLRSGLSLTSSGYLSGSDDIKPYTSTDENNFFRGIALKLQFKKTGLSLFCSLNRIDASFDTSDTLSHDRIKTIYRSGLHNTVSLYTARNALAETFYGAAVFSDFRNLRAGVVWTGCRFSAPVGLPDPDPEDLYDNNGVVFNTVSLYYKSVQRRMIFFGEASAGMNKRIALVQGLSFRPSDRLSINLLFRNYDPGYASYHGRGPFSSSAGDNVRGFFANFTFEAARHLFLSAGCDLKYYPWLKYRCSAPSMSKSSELRIKYLPSENLTIESSFSYRSTMLNDPESTGVKKQIENLSRTIKGSLRYSFSDQVRFGTRVDFRFSQPSGSKGYLLLQDIIYKLNKLPLTIWFRYCIFHTDSWDSRLYTYENDLLNNFGIPALSGTGSRSYMMMEWNAGTHADIRIKYAYTGLISDEDDRGETRELKLQVRLWF